MSENFQSASSQNWVERILGALEEADRRHSTKLRRTLPLEDPFFVSASDDFYGSFFFRPGGGGIASSVQAYLRMLETMRTLQRSFLETGRYPNESLAEAEGAVYANQSVMTDHMLGLALAQFLWIDQFTRFRAFHEWLPDSAHPVFRYLEIGAGHGLYLREAARQLPGANIQVLDISETSLDMVRAVGPGTASYLLADFLEWVPEDSIPFDFLTIGEILEHVENPGDFLSKAHSLLAPRGRAFITTPCNAPMIDHVFLFENRDEIRALLLSSNFRILKETSCATDNLPIEDAERFQVPIMFAALVEKM